MSPRCLDEGGGPHAVLVHVVLLRVALGVGDAGVLIVGFCRLISARCKASYLRHVSHAGPDHALWPGLVQLRLVQTVVDLRSSLAEGGIPLAVLVHVHVVVLLRVALGVGVAEVLMVGYCRLISSRSKTYIPEGRVSRWPWSCPLAWSCTAPSCPASR